MGNVLWDAGLVALYPVVCFTFTVLSMSLLKSKRVCYLLSLVFGWVPRVIDSAATFVAHQIDRGFQKGGN